MALRRIVDPTESPVSVAEARSHLGLFHNGDDSLISLYIDAATSNLDGAQGILGRTLVAQTWELTYDSFPCSAIKVPLPPLVSVESIKYLDADGVEQTLPTTEYTVDVDNQPGWVAPVASWPTTFETINAVRIRFVAGYGAAGKVPAAIRAAILLMVADLYENREGAITGTIHTSNPTMDRLLFPYRMLSP